MVYYIYVYGIYGQRTRILRYQYREVQVMAEQITDFEAFFSGAKAAVADRDELKKRQEELESLEKQQSSALKTKKKALDDEIKSTVKKRSEEITKSYDSQTKTLEDRLKKARSARDKAKDEGVKDRINDETKDLVRQNEDIKGQIKDTLKGDKLPGFCSSTLYNALYFPSTAAEILLLIVCALVCFVCIPLLVYMVIPDRTSVHLFIIYVVVIVIFGGLYIVIGNITKSRFRPTLNQVRGYRSDIRANKKKIKTISKDIKKDKDEGAYDLQKYDDDISKIEQEIKDVASQKKDAVNTFDNVTKNIITDEITGNYQADIDAAQQDLDQTENDLSSTRTALKEKLLDITDNYAIYAGQDFMDTEKLSSLEEIISSGRASNISEAISVYKTKSTSDHSAGQ